MRTGIYTYGAQVGVVGLPTAILGVVGEWASLVSPESLGVSTRLSEYGLYANDAQSEQQTFVWSSAPTAVFDRYL